MLKHAVILAGGKGTRMQTIAKDIPKPMILVDGKPLLEYQVVLCKKYGIEKITLIVNHLKDSIIEYFGNGDSFGIEIEYFEEPYPLGTVGGIKEIEKSIKGDFLVLYGDVMMEMDLQRLFKFHKLKNADATLVIHPNDHPYDSDLVEIDSNDKIIAFHSKPHDEDQRFHNLVNAAAYVFSPKILVFLEKGVKQDFGKDVFPAIINKVNMFGYNTSEYLKDMGTPGRLEKVTIDLKSGKIERRSLNHKQKAIFLDRDGVLNYDTDLIHRTEDFELYDYTASSLSKINKSDYLAIVCTNQSIIARGLTDLQGLSEIHKKMEWELGKEGAFVDAIYFCPHHPDGGFPGEVKEYKVKCDCRKPNPGMLLEAAEKYNIDLSQSYFIGDSERDVLAGKAAGVATIGVMSGHGLKKSNIQPDYFVSNFKDAVDLIFNDDYQQVFKKVKSAFSTSQERPFIISIGGNSRSGKSNLASYLKKEFEKSGNSVLDIKLDNWILPKEQRKNEVDVFHNFQSDKIREDLENILSGNKVKVGGYKVHPKREINPVEYQHQKEDVIIIDGVIGLSTEFLRNISSFKIFKIITENELHDRLKTFYTWKGYNKDSFEKLYQKRKKDEYDIIDKDRIFADLIV